MLTTAPEPMTAVDLVAAAKVVQETLALCGARDARLAGVETKLVERERRVTERDEATAAREASVAKSEQELRGERQRVEALATKAQKSEHDLQAREEDLRKRELNAEAGFAAERRDSLQQLEGEASVLREELAPGADPDRQRARRLGCTLAGGRRTHSRRESASAVDPRRCAR